MENMPNHPDDQPKRISAVIDYCSQINKEQVSFTDVVMAVGNLLDNIDLEIKPTIEDIDRKGYLPFEWELDHDPRIAREKLALLPLACLGEYIDSSAMDIDDAKRWYGEAMGVYMLMNVDDNGEKIHSANCSVDQSSHTTMCDKSTQCPHRYIERLVARSAREPDFTQSVYQENPKRAYDLTGARLIAARCAGVIDEKYMQKLSGEYGRKYLGFVRQRENEDSNK